VTEEILSHLPEKFWVSKLSGSANDFVVLDNRNGMFTDCASELAKRLCARRYSVGADGLILVENSNKASIRIHFFNPDGNEFQTCGNGGRCAARFAFLNVITGRKMTIETGAGVIDAEVVGNNVKLKFVEPSKIQLNVTAMMDGKQIKGHYVRMGDPHYVVFGKNIADHNIVPLARKLRYSESFAPDGANVHFIEILDRSRIRIRSYERGVENETLACGSGCVSAAISTHLSKLTEPPITFEPRSGIPLQVHFQAGNYYQDLYLEGDARLVYRGEVTREAFFGYPVSNS
jgi:diaminopimelate epimerase